jgi:endonuclease YncB( thermonuclease family)
VIRVADGDTITILHGDKAERIRLHGIDCPEKKQPFGKRAKRFTSDVTAGKVVEVQALTKDRYGRTVALVWVDGILLDEALIRAGLARVYSRYCKLAKCTVWTSLQIEARIKKEGLWQLIDTEPPWEFRRHH